MNIEAPVYPPATEYCEPQAAPFEFCIDTLVVNELMASPSIRAMLEEKIPMIGRIVQAPLLKPHLSNFTLRSLVDFGVISGELIEELDHKLRNWPVADRPAL